MIFLLSFIKNNNERMAEPILGIFDITRNILQKIEKSQLYDIFYIKSVSASQWHISIDGITFCKWGAQKVTTHMKNFQFEHFQNENKENENGSIYTLSICFNCVRKAYSLCSKESKIDFKNFDNNLNYDIYDVTWRCNYIISKNKKPCRCSKETKSSYNTFCTQHNVCILKRLIKYIKTESLCNLIINLL